MKKNNRNQSNSTPTLTELLEPYLRDPPSPPQLSWPQSPPPVPERPQPWLHTSSHTLQKPLAKPWRRFHKQSPQYYCVHPRDFRALVQRLTGPTAMLDHDQQLDSGQKRVKHNQNAARIAMESSLPPVDTSFLDHGAQPISSRWATSDNDTPSRLGECRVQHDQNAAVVDKERYSSHDMGTDYLDWFAPPIVSPRTINSMAEICCEEDDEM